MSSINLINQILIYMFLEMMHCLPFQGSTSFVDLFMGFFLSCVCYAFVSVCLYVPCGHLLERADLLALVCGVEL